MPKLALVFSGGGAKGAFGVGVIDELVNLFPDLRWDIVSGTSTGALIVPFAALGARDRSALSQLRTFYLGATKSGILTSNIPFGFLTGLPTGLYKTKPLSSKIDAIITDAFLERIRQSGVVAAVNAVNLQTGQLEVCAPEWATSAMQAWFDSHSLGEVVTVPFKSFRGVMLASASMPAIMEPVEIGANREIQLVDGGVVDIAPLRTALAAGADAVLGVLMSPQKEAPVGKQSNLVPIGLRAIELLTAGILRGDMEYADYTSDMSVLSKHLLAADGKLPSALQNYVDANRARLNTFSNRREIDFCVLEPETGLGDTLDFDSQVPVGWPEAPSGGNVVPIMRARYEYGRRLVKKRIDKITELVSVVSPTTTKTGSTPVTLRSRLRYRV